MNQAAPDKDSLPDRISCLLLGLESGKLLVPITAVAEVINTQVAVVNAVAEGFLYGWIEWRDQNIPLVSLEAMAGSSRPSLAIENRLVILNAIGDGAERGFYAALLKSLPTPVHVDKETLAEGEPGLDSLALAQCHIGGESVTIPDLLAVESRIAGVIH